MSFVIELRVPDIGSDGVEVIEVQVQAGDEVELEQTLVVLETDKASIDLPATAAGTLQEIKVKVGDTLSEGDLIATVLASTEQSPAKAAEPKAEEKQAPAPIDEPEKTPAVAKPPAPVANQQSSTTGKAHATPSVRRFARELGVDLSLINKGSGRKGRILKDDVKNFVKQALSSGGGAMQGSGIPPIPSIDFSKFGETESQQLSKIKRLTGKNLSRAWLNLPMVTQHNEADITEMEAFRKSINADKNTEIKMSPLVFIIKAVVSGLKQYPQFNSSLSANGEQLIYKKYVNIGIAVDTPNGLVVPVIKNADKKTVVEITQEMAELSGKARQGKLMPADMQGASMTISSLGGIGGTAFTPIVNAPEVAILGVSRASMQPVWDGNEFKPRLILPLDLTYDHRVIDGADGARFSVAIAQYLTDIRRLLL